MSSQTITGTYRENAAPARIPVHFCPDCGGLGSEVTHGRTCRRAAGKACWFCGREFYGWHPVATVDRRVPDARQCIGEIACRERQLAGAA